jgi:hypothetical protein
VLADNNPNLLPDTRASVNNIYLNYSQRATEVGPTTYNVLQGGVTAAAGSAWRAGDPNLVAQSPYLNSLPSYTDFNNTPQRNPVGTATPSAYSYAMAYIIKT